MSLCTMVRKYSLQYFLFGFYESGKAIEGLYLTKLFLERAGIQHSLACTRSGSALGVL